MGQKLAFYSIGFNTSTESTDVDILDWQYGVQASVDQNKQWILRAPQYWVSQGRPMGGGGDNGMMPVGDFLYVKWRIKNSGEVHEDRVNLSNKLPVDMNHYSIHWLVIGAQLHVFLFPPFETKDTFGRVTVHGGQSAGYIRGKTFLEMPYNLQHQIYPK